MRLAQALDFVEERAETVGDAATRAATSAPFLSFVARTAVRPPIPIPGPDSPWWLKTAYDHES